MSAEYSQATSDATALALGGLSFYGGERRNKAQQAVARDQMAFQEQMSNTAYERAMRDMRRAGLNPILAGKLGGASTPGGAMPQLHDSITPAIQTGVQAFEAGRKGQYQEAQTALANADATLKEALAPGAQTISILTQRIKELVEAADGVLSDNMSEYDGHLGNALFDSIRELINKTDQKVAVMEKFNKMVEEGKVKIGDKTWNQLNESVPELQNDVIRKMINDRLKKKGK